MKKTISTRSNITSFKTYKMGECGTAAYEWSKYSSKECKKVVFGMSYGTKPSCFFKPLYFKDKVSDVRNIQSHCLVLEYYEDGNRRLVDPMFNLKIEFKEGTLDQAISLYIATISLTNKIDIPDSIKQGSRILIDYQLQDSKFFEDKTSLFDKCCLKESIFLDPVDHYKGDTIDAFCNFLNGYYAPLGISSSPLF